MTKPAAAQRETDIVRKAGGKATFARVAVMIVLANHGEHVTALDVRKMVAARAITVDVSTIHRTLA